MASELSKWTDAGVCQPVLSCFLGALVLRGRVPTLNQGLVHTSGHARRSYVALAGAVTRVLNMIAAGPATAQSDDPVPAAGDFAQVPVAGAQADETPRLASEPDATVRAPGAVGHRRRRNVRPPRAAWWGIEIAFDEIETHLKCCASAGSVLGDPG